MFRRADWSRSDPNCASLVGSSGGAVARYTSPIVLDLQRQAFEDNSTHELTAVLMSALQRSAREGARHRVVLSCSCDASAPVRVWSRARARKRKRLGPLSRLPHPPVCAWGGAPASRASLRLARALTFAGRRTLRARTPAVVASARGRRDSC